jgi:hypothetical protein
MKTHFSEEIEESAHFDKSAADQTWRHKRPQSSSAIVDLAAIVVLAITFFGLVSMSLTAKPAVPPVKPGVAEELESPPRPIWVSTVPFAPRDGIVPEITPALTMPASTMTRRQSPAAEPPK